MRENNLIDFGKLKIQLSSESEVVVENAKVRILKSNTDEVIDEVITNSSGQTKEIELKTPPIEFSQEPDNPKPFSEYDLVIEKEGYMETLIKGAQIFPENVAIQNATLVEKKEMTNRKVNLINIPYPTLWGNYPPKTPEAPLKKIPDPTGYVVLDEPVVPEFIIVHDGNPDVYAEDLWIEFKDYIKNVASSEVYSSWPVETLKANILAIISFTMNRVFTEWYRGKGKNFTITSQTAYDQKFSYGRTVYKNIVNIVDELFNQYITRENIRQPILTQYCDGSKTQCPNWLSQWGSKYLGDQGYNYLDILKNYYGNEIILRETIKVSGIPISYPGDILKVGSSGQNVLTIQEQLNTISNYYPAIPKVKQDGVYGKETEDAVKKFQEIFNLPVDGQVGFSTWYKISSIYVAVTKLTS